MTTLNSGLSQGQEQTTEMEALSSANAAQGTRLERLLDVATRVFRILPFESPPSMSEHFDHSEERNDPNPHFTSRVI